MQRCILANALALVCMILHPCFAIKTLKVNLRAARELANARQRRRRANNFVDTGFYKVKPSSLASTKCKEYGNGMRGSVCALDMTLELKKEAFSVIQHIFDVNLCRRPNGEFCQHCFDGELCGRLCAYEGINCVDAWKNARRTTDTDVTQYLLNPFRTSNACTSTQCPQLKPGRDIDKDGSFSAVGVSKEKCDDPKKDGYFGWMCAGKDMEPCLADERDDDGKGCTKEKPCAIEFKGKKKRDSVEAEQFKCEEASSWCHEAFSCMDSLETEIEIISVSSPMVEVKQCPGEKKPCLQVTFTDPQPYGILNIEVEYSVTQGHVDDKDKTATSPPAIITLTGTFDTTTTPTTATTAATPFTTTTPTTATTAATPSTVNSPPGTTSQNPTAMPGCEGLVGKNALCMDCGDPPGTKCNDPQCHNGFFGPDKTSQSQPFFCMPCFDFSNDADSQVERCATCKGPEKVDCTQATCKPGSNRVFDLATRTCIPLPEKEEQNLNSDPDGGGGIVAVVIAVIVVVLIGAGAAIVVILMKKKMEREARTVNKCDEDRGPRTPSRADILNDPAAKAAGMASMGHCFTDLLLAENQVTLGEKFAAGGEAQIFHGTFGSQHVALKEEIRLFATHDESLAHETGLLVKMRHPNIVTFFGLWNLRDTNRVFMVLEYCQGDIEHYMKDHVVGKRQKYVWAMQMADALNYLHSRSPPIIHRDVKLRNVLVDKNLDAKFTDFGIAKISKEDRDVTIQMGTIAYMPPEAMGEGDESEEHDDNKVRSQIDGKKWDVYSLAVCYAHLFTGQQVYEGMVNNRIYILVRMQDGRPKLPGVGKPTKDLIRKMWCKDFHNRLGAEEVLTEIKALQEKVSSQHSNSGKNTGSDDETLEDSVEY